MAMKKGYCTNCNKHDESRRIFEVNSEAKFCYCPHCGKKYRPRIAILNYERTISKYLRKAYFYLKNVGETLLAYNLFAYVLELEPNNRTAKYGRLLSLCYLSNLRRNRFNEVRELLSIEKDDFHIKSTRDEYIAFLISTNHCVDDYLARVKRKVTFRHYFYDPDCSKLYFKHIVDAIELKRLLAEELSVEEVEKQSSFVNDSIKELENVFQASFFTVDGQEHRLVNFAKSGDPLIVNGKKKEDTARLLRYRMCTLDIEDKKKRYLKDTVFALANHRIYKFFKLSVFLFALMLAFATGFLITYFVLMKQNFSLLFLILAISSGVIALFLLALRLLFSSRLKKPRL